MEDDTQGQLLALAAMNLRIISELAAASPGKESEVFDRLEAGILNDLERLISSEDDEIRRARMRHKAKGYLTDWLVGIRPE
jgi:hypothetical protein